MPSSSPQSPFPRIAISHLEARAQPIHYRQTQLHRLQTELAKSSNDIKASIRADEGHTAHEADFELTLVLSELRQHYDALNPKTALEATRQIEIGSSNPSRRRGTSIVYIVPSQHTLLYSVLSPICAAIAAGNCAVVELPQTLRSVTSILRKVVSSSLDADTVAISDTRPETDFLRRCTLVLQSQPYELPKAHRKCVSPSFLRALAMVDRTARIDDAAQAIARARFSRRGSSPYAPDVVLVNEFVLEEFLASLLRYVSPYMAQENGSIENLAKQKQHRMVADGQRILDAAEKSEHMRIVVRGSNGNVISVQNREANILSQKIKGPILVVHAISSLDDGIDMANKSAESSTLAASFLFAALPEANYLANFIDAHLSCVNHIPAELLVGPIAPLHHTPSLSLRYTTAMFQEPRPQLLHKTALTTLVEGVQQAPSDTRLAELKKSLEAPLPPMNRKDGRDVDFFFQAVMTGVTVVGLPVLVGIGVAAKYALPYVWQRV